MTEWFKYAIIILSRGELIDNNRLVDGKESQTEEGERMKEMTDKQFKTILEMVDMILDGCEDLDEAKRKIQKLIDNQNVKEKSE